MLNTIEVTVTDLDKKHQVNRKSGYEGMYSVHKHVYMDDGKIDTTGFAIDKENLRISGARIDAMLIDGDKPNNKKKPTQ